MITASGLVALLLVSVNHYGLTGNRIFKTNPRIGDGRAKVGEPLYHAHCAVCHGSNLEGQPNWRKRMDNGLLRPPPHDANGHTWHHDDELLFDYTKFGGAGAMVLRGIDDLQSGMPAFENQLSDQEVLDVLAFIRSTWPNEVQKMQSERNAN